MMLPRQDGFGHYERGRRPRRFLDRRDAGSQLAAALQAYRGSNPLVLGIPRGGVPVAYEVAKALDGDLDVIVARKIGAPSQPELAIGAVACDGTRYINAKLRTWAGLSDAALERLADVQQAEARASEQRFRAELPPLDPSGRIAIVVDDGLATGATMRAALRSLRARGAQQLVVALPVGAPQACRSLEREVDRLLCLQQPEVFDAVGQHYEVFDQTTDAEVEGLLRKQRKRRAQGLK